MPTRPQPLIETEYYGTDNGIDQAHLVVTKGKSPSQLNQRIERSDAEITRGLIERVLINTKPGEIVILRERDDFRIKLEASSEEGLDALDDNFRKLLEESPNGLTVEEFMQFCQINGYMEWRKSKNGKRAVLRRTGKQVNPVIAHQEEVGFGVLADVTDDEVIQLLNRRARIRTEDEEPLLESKGRPNRIVPQTTTAQLRDLVKKGLGNRPTVSRLHDGPLTTSLSKFGLVEIIDSSPDKITYETLREIADDDEMAALLRDAASRIRLKIHKSKPSNSDSSGKNSSPAGPRESLSA